MKRACLLAVLLVPWVAHAQTAPDVMIAELLPDPGEGREFIELWSAAAVDLTGWHIEDAAGNRFALDGHAIGAGARLVVWGGGEATAEGPAWSKAAVWNNGGDTAYLFHGDVLVDSFAYGSAGGPAAPPSGQSLAWDGQAWVVGSPTPGQAPPATATMEVEDVPPEVRFGPLPADVAPAEPVEISWSVHDPNGDADITVWRLYSDEVLVANGAAAGDFADTFVAPEHGTWRLRVEADDASQTTVAEVTIAIQAENLRVVLPPEGIRFPAIAPGATGVEASAPFTIYNDGASTVTARIDIADFHGPDPFAAGGLLSLLVNGEAMPYDGPFSVVGEVPAGGSLQVLLRIDEVPLPLAAGTYGTSFAVVA